MQPPGINFFDPKPLQKASLNILEKVKIIKKILKNPILCVFT